MAGPKILPKGFSQWPDRADSLRVSEVRKLYESGFAGAYGEPEEEERFLESIAKSGGFTEGGDAATANNWAGSGEGQLSIPYVYTLILFPGCWPGAGQAVGDCAVAGTPVRMGDGSEKPIEDIQIGDMVMTHNGRGRRVTRTIAKPYTGDVIDVQCRGYAEKVTFTPDHQFIEYPSIWSRGESSYSNWRDRSEEWKWTPIGEMQPGDYLMQPRMEMPTERLKFDLADMDCMDTDAGKSGRQILPPAGKVRCKFSRSPCNRYVELDDRLAWLIGLFIAEGSSTKRNNYHNRITFNLSHDETLIAEQAAEYIREIFGVKCTVSQVPSKPTVTYVRCSNIGVAEFFRMLVPGNTYKKRVPSAIYRSPKSVQMSCLRGWLDGDGCLSNRHRTEKGKEQFRALKLSGVSVSHALVRDMFAIANNLGLRGTITKRKPRGASRSASDLHLYGNSAIAVYPETVDTRVRVQKKHQLITSDGIAAEIKSLERRHFEGNVYCIDVEEDHSFVAGSFAVHNCVSHDSKNANMLSYSSEIIEGKPDEVSGKVEEAPKIPGLGLRQGAFSTEVGYWFRRHGGHGWSCDASANVGMKEAGLVTRDNHPEIGVDLTRYSKGNVERYGRTPPRGAIADALDDNLIRQASPITGGRKVRRDFVANGYGISSCGSEGFSDVRDKYGVARRSGSWAHALAEIAFDDRASTIKLYGQSLELLLNSWAIWNSGPRDIHDSAGYVPALQAIVAKVIGLSIDAALQWLIKQDIVNPDTGNVMIPKGAMWVRSGDIDRRRFIAKSSVNGWPRRAVSLGLEGNV